MFSILKYQLFQHLLLGIASMAIITVYSSLAVIGAIGAIGISQGDEKAFRLCFEGSVGKGGYVGVFSRMEYISQSTFIMPA